MISFIRTNDIVIGKIVGSLDKNSIANITTKTEIELSQDTSKIVLDFKEVDFIDDTGIGYIAYLLKRLHEVEIINCSPSIKRTITFCGLNSVNFN